MQILADEGLDGPIVEWLRKLGHDVRWMAEASSGSSDVQVVSIAEAEARVIVTMDRDFGDLVFRGGAMPRGLVYLRWRTNSASQLLAAFQRIWPSLETQADGNFIVASPGRIRIRSLRNN